MADWEDAPTTAKAVDGWESAPSNVSAFMKGQTAPAVPWYKKAWQGATDMVYGAAQIGAHMPEEGVDANPAEAQKQQQERAATVDKIVQTREQTYQDQRKASGDTGFDWWRMGGNVASTLPLSAVGGVAGGATLAARLAGATLGGMTGGALQPVTEGDFGTEKAKQVAIGGGAGLVTGGAAEGASAGVKAFGSYLAKEFPENIQHHAVQAILRRFSDDKSAGGPTAQQALDLLNTARTEGKPLTLADLGGENVKQLGGYVARQPGESRNFVRSTLMGRDEGASSRLSADVSKYVSGGPSMHQTTEALIESRSAASAPLYDEAYAANQNVMTPAINRILDTPAGKKALVQAANKMRNDQTLVGRPDPALMEQINESGQLIPWKGGVASGLKLRTLDYVKRSLDDQIGTALKAGEKDDARILIGLKNEFVSELDKADVTGRAGPNSLKPEGGAYARARASYSGPSQSLNALEFGRNVFKATPEENAAAFAKLSPNDKEFARLGVADVLRERIAKTGFGGNEARALIKNAWTRDQLRPIFRTPEEFDKFTDAVMAEHTMADTTTRTLRGSQTAERLAEDNSPGNKAIHGAAKVAKDLATANWLGAVSNAWKLKRDLGMRQNPALNSEIARLLYTPNLSGATTGGQRLLGALPGPQTTNYLAPAAQSIRQLAPALAPTVGAAVAP